MEELCGRCSEFIHGKSCWDPRSVRSGTHLKEKVTKTMHHTSYLRGATVNPNLKVFTCFLPLRAKKEPGDGSQEGRGGDPEGGDVLLETRHHRTLSSAWLKVIRAHS